MRRKPSLLSDIRSLFLWTRLVREVQPSIVSIGTPKAALLGLLASRWNRVKVRVYMLRGLRLEGTNRLTRRIMTSVERATARSATMVVSVSNSLRQTYVDLQLCEPGKILVIGHGSSHGVNLERFAPDGPVHDVHLEKIPVSDAGGPTYTLGFVGRFSRDKGANQILLCHRFLIEQGIKHKLVIVGPVEDSREIAEELATSVMPVRFVGLVSNTAVFYRLFDLLLLPTKREGFPNVALEAAACGIPVVTTTATGAVDSVLDGETGAVVPLGHEQDFCETVADLLLNSSVRAQMGEKGRSWVESHFDEKQVTTAHTNFYENLLSGVGHNSDNHDFPGPRLSR